MDCYDDEMCMNIDQENSTPGNVVYECPGSTCNSGTCSCGAGCLNDTRTGICSNPSKIIPANTDPTAPPTSGSPSVIPPTSGAPSTSGAPPTSGLVYSACKKMLITDKEFVCWKQVIDQDGIMNIKDCTPSECGITTTSYTKRDVNGTYSTVYNNDDVAPGEGVEVDKPLPVWAIVLIAIGGLLFLIFIVFLIMKFANK